MNEIVKVIIKEANKAFKSDEVPVGAAVIYKNKIISKAHNTKQKKHCCINHAEILAIKKASHKLKDWRLEDCDLYVTLEPCNMCMEVIRQSRISKVYYLLESHFNSEKKKKIDVINIPVKVEVIEEYKGKIQSFFRIKR